MSPLRVAVVGAGHMGGLHAAKLNELAREGDCALVGVADLIEERARAAVGESGARVATSHRALLDGADAVVVAVPTLRHFEIVRDCLEAGCHVLVEKPIAAALEEAEALIRIARGARRVLHVGHLEWHNSVLRGIAPMIRKPRFVEAHRMGPFAGRATDVDIIRDLMIHDLDIVQRLVGEEPAQVEGIGVPVISEELDIAHGRLRFPGGCIANFTASRVSPTPMRKIRIFQSDAYISIDFLEQAASILRRRRDRGGKIQIDTEALHFDRDDALVSQTRAFLDAIASKTQIDFASTDAALRALRSAMRVIETLPPLDELR
jgi:predicted dehydrogenase